MCFLDSYWVCHMNGNGVAPQNEMLYNSNNWPFYLLSPASEIWPVPIWAFRPWKIATSSSHPILHSMYWWADRYHLLWIIKTLIICDHSSTTPKVLLIPKMNHQQEGLSLLSHGVTSLKSHGFIAPGTAVFHVLKHPLVVDGEIRPFLG